MCNVDHPSGVETVWECQKFLGAVRGGATRSAQGVGVGATNSRGVRWVKFCIVRAFREVFNIITIMLSKKQGGRHARDHDGVICRVVLPKGYETGAPLRCFAPIHSLLPLYPAALINPPRFHSLRPVFS